MSSEKEVRAITEQSLDRLQPAEIPEISIYLHFPFCTSRCHYCSFYFETGVSPRVLEAVLGNMLRESAWWRSRWKRAPKIRTVYFGGGTPSLIPPQTLSRFVSDLSSIWEIPRGKEAPQEFAFEANPESLTAEHFEAFANCGVDRLSMGVQTLNDGLLSDLGRRAGSDKILSALGLVQAARARGDWSGKLNVDLISGLPGQTSHDIDRSVEGVLVYRPDHVSLYTLSVEEHTPLYQSWERSPGSFHDADAGEDLWEHADGLLEKSGFHNYEISNYAKAGSESRHNTVYWELRPWLGIGPGAVGNIPLSDGTWMRTTNPQAFLYGREDGFHANAAIEHVSAKDFFLEHFIVGLRLEKGLDLELLATHSGVPLARIKSAMLPQCTAWRERGFLTTAQSENRIAFSRKARFVLHPILREFMSDFDSTWEELRA